MPRKNKTIKDKKRNTVKVNNEKKEGRNQTFAVGGYVFKDKNTAEAAQNENNAIKYMSSRTNRKDSTQVYLLYNKILDKKLFQTVIGLNYLKELQEYLYANDAIPNEKIRPIPIDDMMPLNAIETSTEGSVDSAAEFKKRMLLYKYRSVRLIIINVILLLMIVAMFYIVQSGSSTTVLNYEYNIQNKYSSWDMELKSKEASLKERENKIKEKESMQNQSSVHPTVQPTIQPTIQNNPSSSASTEKSSVSNRK